MTAYLPSLLASSICTQSASLVRLQGHRLHTKLIPLSKQSVVRCTCGPVWGRGSPLPPLSIFSPSSIGFTYFLLLPIPSLSTRIVPLRFQARGRRRRPNVGLVCVLLCILCYLYSLVKMDCCVLFYLV